MVRLAPSITILLGAEGKHKVHDEYLQQQKYSPLATHDASSFKVNDSRQSDENSSYNANVTREGHR